MAVWEHAVVLRSTRCETATTGQIGFVPGELIDIATNEAPLMIDTATVTEEGLYSLGLVEHAMHLVAGAGGARHA